MNKNYKVIWSDIAESDLMKIIGYIAEESHLNALKILKKIKEKASSLYQYPEQGRTVPELQDHGILQYRELIVSPWRIVYRLSGKNVYVVAVIDSHQNIEDILFKRLTNFI